VAYKIWRLRVEGATYTVQMNHRLFTGEVQVLLDGATVFQGIRDIGYVTRHKFRLPNWWNGHVEIHSIGMDCYYELSLEGRIIDPESDQDTLLRGSADPNTGLLRPFLPNRSPDGTDLVRPTEDGMSGGGSSAL